MKAIAKLILLSLLFTGCSKVLPDEPVKITFDGVYTYPICMGKKPVNAIMVFDKMTLVFPVYELEVGVRSKSYIEIPPGDYRLLDVYVEDEDGNVTSYAVHETHESGIVVIWIIEEHIFRINKDFNYVAQLFCEEIPVERKSY